MASAPSNVAYLPPGVEIPVKIVVMGPFGVGKTTYVNTTSEIPPLATEETMTSYSETIDTLDGLDDKKTTTVAMDFGRRTLTDGIVLYVFGAPGQDRYQEFVNSLMIGALGGLVLADTRHIHASFPSIERLEKAGVPYVVAVNNFDGAPDYAPAELREAFDLECDTPLIVCDARDFQSAKGALLALVEHLIRRQSMEPTP